MNKPYYINGLRCLACEKDRRRLSQRLKSALSRHGRSQNATEDNHGG